VRGAFAESSLIPTVTWPDLRTGGKGRPSQLRTVRFFNVNGALDKKDKESKRGHAALVTEGWATA